MTILKSILIIGMVLFASISYAEDYSDEIIEFRPKAVDGDQRYQLVMGNIYQFGDTKDYGGAIKWYRKAAEQGNSEAYYYLGGLYYEGQGTDRNYRKAYKAFKASSELGNKRAQLELGIMDENGLLKNKDFASAYMWYKLGDHKEYMDNIKKKMTERQLNDAEKRVATCLNSFYKGCYGV